MIGGCLCREKPDRRLEPVRRLAGPKPDLQNRRQSGKEQLARVLLAAEVAADESRHLATTSRTGDAQIAGECSLHVGRGVPPLTRAAIPYPVRFAVRKDDYVAALKRELTA